MDTDYSHWSVSPGGKVLSLNKFRLACVSGNFYYNWKTSGFQINGLLIQKMTNLSTNAVPKEFLLPLSYKNKKSYAAVGTVNYDGTTHTHMGTTVGKLDGRRILVQTSYSSTTQNAMPFSVITIGTQPNGLLVQAGILLKSRLNDILVLFPIAFSEKCLSIAVTPDEDAAVGTGAFISVKKGTLSRTGFKVRGIWNSGYMNAGVYYISVGF